VNAPEPLPMLEPGADAGARNVAGYTALMVAEKHGYSAVAAVLRQHRP
jgi:ankyrin repeat protein